jgi:signal transduction histidine kinase
MVVRAPRDRVALSCFAQRWHHGFVIISESGSETSQTSKPAVEPVARVSTSRDVLVVDDSEANLLAIEAALQPLGRRLVFARSGEEALARLLEQDFILIVLDVSMPTIDGFEAARLIRARPRSSRTPIIFLTGLDWNHEIALQGYRLGAVDFLIKPIHEEILLAKASVFIALEERTLEAQHRSEDLRIAHARELERELTIQRQQFEVELASASMKELEQANRRKDTFLAILGHELRNPLQPLRSALELIDHRPDEPVRAPMRTIMRGRLARIERLVDDLLDVARLNADKLELDRELVPLAEIVDEAVVDLRGVADEGKYRLAIAVDPSARVLGDRVRLIQIVTNLLNNAFKYTEPGGAIDVRVEVADGHAIVRVTDTGKGIDGPMLERIFEMFVQDRARTSGYGGLGLGLGLAKRLVELHGGTVHAESAGLGRGSTFEVRLPAAAGVAEVPRGDSPTPGPAPSHLRVVVVEDQDDARQLLAEILEQHGHLVRTYADGRAAIKGILDDPPDFALIDIGLPEIDGYEVARVVRRELRDRPTTLIAMTGYGQADDRSEALAAGFNDHIVKPASYSKIETTLRV